jgi:hypothetical protein
LVCVSGVTTSFVFDNLPLEQSLKGVKSELLELTIAQKVWNLFLLIIKELIGLFDFKQKQN